jgi:hypothetical protein
MGWHGPQGDCGCCNVEPPPPPCACPESDCVPEGLFQFSSIRTEADWDDEFFLIDTNTQFPTTGDCAGQTVLTYSERRITGMSAINGTYDAAFIKLVDDEWVEADPETECGYWFFPLIDVELGWTDIHTRTSTYGCITQTFSNFVGTRNVYFSTYYGAFVSKIDAMPSFQLAARSHTENHVATAYRSIVFDPYECKPEDEQYTFNDSWWVTNPSGGNLPGDPGAGFPPRTFPAVAQQNAFQFDPLFGPPIAGPIGIGQQVVTIVYDGQTGQIRPYRTGAGLSFVGGTCAINWQQAANTLDAYYDKVTIGSPGQDFYRIREIEWPSFSRRHAVILNA